MYLVEHERNEPCRFIFVCLFFNSHNANEKEGSSYNRRRAGRRACRKDPRISRFGMNNSSSRLKRKKKIPEIYIVFHNRSDTHVVSIPRLANEWKYSPSLYNNNKRRDSKHSSPLDLMLVLFEYTAYIYYVNLNFDSIPESRSRSSAFFFFFV